MKTVISFLATNLTMALAIAAPPVIGTVTANGAFRLNGDTVRSNGTLTEGAVIETGLQSSSLRLTDGARLSLLPNSRGKLYKNRIVLEKGETRMDNGAGFHLEALGLTIHPSGPLSLGRIGILGTNRVRVAVLAGSFRVRNARGVLIGNVPAGSALAFEPQAPAAATQITGTLTLRNGHFLLTDTVAQVTVEVTGPGLEGHVGQIVQVTGTVNLAATPVAEASQVIAATSVQTVAATAGAGGAAAAGAGGAAAGTGIGATTIAIIGGVAVAATLGGLAVADALPGQGSTPESR